MRNAFVRMLLVVATVLAAIQIPLFGQSTEGLGMSPTVEISIGRNRAVKESLGFHNAWNLIGRHCQAYSVLKHKYLHKLTFGKRFRALVPDEAACNADPSTQFYAFNGHNVVTNAGYDHAASALSNTSTQSAACNYFGLAIDSSNAGAGTVAITDTTLASSGTGSTELTGDVARNTAPRETYAHTASTLTYTLSKAYAITTTHTGINKLGLFNAISAGTMCFELLVTPANVINGDTLTPTLTNTMSNP